jgi:hypothetical protein
MMDSKEDGQSFWAYVVCAFDNLLIATRDPYSMVQSLQEKHKFKLEGVVSLTYHLGCDYFHNMDGTLCYWPRKYIDNIMRQ